MPLFYISCLTSAFSLFTFLLLSGCDQTFQPIQDNYRAPFSMFGYLDASGGSEWKEEFRELGDYRYSLPEAISNVEGGTGYMFGIVNKSVPFKNCYNDNGIL